MTSRVDSLRSWHADWRGLKTAVVGLGVSGFAVADTLAELGCEVFVVAGAQDPERQPLLDVIGATLFVGSDSEQLHAIQEFEPELIVISPGYPAAHPIRAWATETDTPIFGEIELAWRLRDKTGKPAEWITITGTNGKTTTTQLTAHIFKNAGYRVAPVGNIGTPVLDAIRYPDGFDVLIVELSSFQLHDVHTVEPWASACLNIAADHIDWHGDFDAYKRAKANVFERTKTACVFNRADRVTLSMVEQADVQEGARAVSFGLDTPLVAELGVFEDLLVDRGFHAERRTSALPLISLHELIERGIAQPHMVQNALAASALARSFDISPEVIHETLLEFTPDAHRMQLIAVHNGVTWIDDSKATNAHAAHAALQSQPSVVWILGGLLKGVDLSELVKTHAPRLRGAVIVGADREHLKAVFAEHAPAVPVNEVDAEKGLPVMQQAVKLADQLTNSGDTVLLAPAAASMDQFASYSDRGELFIRAVSEHLGL